MDSVAVSEFAVWLTPVPSDRRWLSKVIQDYASAYDTPVFEPHVTVYSGTSGPEDNLNAIVTQATDGLLLPIQLDVVGLGYTHHFFKSGFIAFATCDRLSQLSHRIRQSLSISKDYEIDPHLSLVYKDIPLEQKRLAMLRIVVSVQHISFDTVKVVVPSQQGWMDIPGWTEIYAVPCLSKR
ncbi:MAG: hypothetical protein WCD18_16795 [Thermosynechococcaceae cyanobacterium]